MTFSRYSGVSLGLDSVLNRLDALAAAPSNYPPYNITQVGERDETVVTLEIALAGISRDRIEVVTERGVLTVTVKAAEEEDDRVYLHKGLAQRSFTKNFQLGDDAVVDGVTYVDGLLTVTVSRELPEAQKRKTFQID